MRKLPLPRRRLILGAGAIAALSTLGDNALAQQIQTGVGASPPPPGPGVVTPVRRLGIVGDSIASIGYLPGGPSVNPQLSGSSALGALIAVSRGAFYVDPLNVISISGGTSALCLAALQAGQMNWASIGGLVIETGINDFLGGATQAAVEANIKAMVTLCRINGVTPIIVLVNHISTNEGSTYVTQLQLNRATSSLNRWKTEFCRQSQIPTINYEVMNDPTNANGGYKSGYNSGDLIHPSAQAYIAAAQSSLANELLQLDPVAEAFLPVTPIDLYDATWAPRGNLAGIGFIATSGSSPPTGLGQGFSQVRSGKTQTFACASLYPGQTTAADGYGGWATWTLSGTGTGGGANDSCYFYINNGYLTGWAPGDTIEFGCEIAASGVSGNWAFQLQLLMYDNTSTEINASSPVLSFGSQNGTSGPASGTMPAAVGPLLASWPYILIPPNAATLKMQGYFYWNDTANTFAGTFGMRRPTIRKVLSSTY